MYTSTLIELNGYAPEVVIAVAALILQLSNPGSSIAITAHTTESAGNDMEWAPVVEIGILQQLVFLMAANVKENLQHHQNHTEQARKDHQSWNE